jgi:threonine dehydrogenase-like Zn-dependent dehydrogenase
MNGKEVVLFGAGPIGLLTLLSANSPGLRLSPSWISPPRP